MEDEVYRGDKERKDEITRLKNDIAEDKIIMDAEMAKNVLIWHMIFKADDLKDEHISASLTKLCEGTIPLYAQRIIRIGPRSGKFSGDELLSKVVARSVYQLMAKRFRGSLTILVNDLVEAWNARLKLATAPELRNKVDKKFQTLYGKLKSVVSDLEKGDKDIQESVAQLLEMGQANNAYHGALIDSFPDTVSAHLREIDTATGQPKIKRFGPTPALIMAMREEAASKGGGVESMDSPIDEGSSPEIGVASNGQELKQKPIDTADLPEVSSSELPSAPPAEPVVAA